MSKKTGSSVQILMQSWRNLFKDKKPRSLKPPRYQIVMTCSSSNEWTETNRLAGWANVQLDKKGEVSARRSGAILKEMGFDFDVAFTSTMQRTKRTLEIILEMMEMRRVVPVISSWRLNGRQYGIYTGMTPNEMGEKVFAKLWNDYHFTPPELDPGSEIYKKIFKNPELAGKDVPLTESRLESMFRVVPYWEQTISKEVKMGKSVIICAHRDSLFGLIAHLDQLTQKHLEKVRLPKGVPFLYTLDEDMVPVENGSCRFVFTIDEIEKALQAELKSGARPLVK